MKKIILFLATLSFCLSSMAETANPIEKLVAAINYRLSEISKSADDDSNKYCKVLSEEQIVKIQDNIILENNNDPSKVVYRNLHNVAVDDFVGVVAGNLNCYRLVSAKQGRRSGLGVILNQVGYRKDMGLLYEAFSDMTGTKVTGRERVSTILGL
jgi:hypothetical protein